MAYSINPNLPKARALAMQLLNQEGLPLQVVANRSGVHRSTIWRWQKKWQEINQNVQLENFNRPTRTAGTQFRLAALRWLIPTLSSRPCTKSQGN
jgi:transposase